jgi:hypothetical protein
MHQKGLRYDFQPRRFRQLYGSLSRFRFPSAEVRGHFRTDRARRDFMPNTFIPRGLVDSDS